jgi:hypothetical protein
MFFQRTLIEKLPFLLVNTLLFCPSISPYQQTNKQIEGETNTLAAHGLEHLLRVGLRNFFSGCALVSFLFGSGGK